MHVSDLVFSAQMICMPTKYAISRAFEPILKGIISDSPGLRQIFKTLQK